MINKMLRTRIRNGEDVATEFVANPRSVGDVGKAVCAFLNSSGGTILVGVRRNGKLVGASTDPEKLAVLLETKIQKSIAPSSMFTVTVDDVDGAAVIVVEVPAGKDQPYVYDGTIFVRDGVKSKAANADALRDLVRRQVEEPERWERRLSPSMTPEDIDLQAVKDLMDGGVQRAGLDSERLTDPFEFLRLMSLRKENGFTQGGDVLFARRPDQRHPQCRVQYVVFQNSRTDETYSDYRWYEGPLPKVAIELFDALSSINTHRQLFSETSLQRESQPIYPMSALREALVNALVHRDYTSYSGGVRISVYPDRIEFWNSGQLPDELNVSDLKKVHPSIPTNPDISHIFYLNGLMERVGRGTLKIIEACARLKSKKPKWENRKSGVTLTIYAATDYTNMLIELNDRQTSLLTGMDTGDVISPSDYYSEYAASVSPRQARRDLVELEEAGFLQRKGAGPSTKYHRLDQPIRT